MKKKVLPVFIALLLLLSVVLTGCGGSGITQADLDAVKAQLTDAQSQLTRAQADKTAADENYRLEMDKVAGLELQIENLKAQYQLADLTPSEMAEKIVQNYHATHVYSTFDMFICSDMSSEVWNMLKAQGISSVIVVGNKDTSIGNILESNHAWVLADVGNGEKLALETTGGFIVPRSQNANYYHGWSFSSPADITANNDLVKEYNLRVEFRNLLKTAVNEAQTSYNNASNQVEADKYMLLYTTLKDLKDAQETILNQLMADISGLATQF